MEATSSSKQTRFTDWLTANNARFPKLEFRNDVQGSGSVYCTGDIAENEIFLTVPFTPLVITDTLAREQLPASVQSLDGRTALTLFLVQQVLMNVNAGTNGASFFQPYLDMVPERIHTALDFDDDDLEQLRGTNAFLTVKELKENLLQKYKDTMRVVGDDLRIEDGYSWERFLWAETVLSSRAFPAHLFGGGIEGEIVLIPLGGKLDTLNHKSRQKATWIKTPQGLEMSGGAISKGDQIFNNYGPKSNEELLVGYGFCIEDNLDDLVVIKPNFSRDPDQERKTEILKHVGVTEQTIHYLRYGSITDQSDSIPDQLLVTMRVMAMNPAEAGHCCDLIHHYEHQLESEEDESEETQEARLKIAESAISVALRKELQFLGVRNEFAMLDLLDMLLNAKLQGILEWDSKLDAPKNQAQEFARIYRRGQRQILEAGSNICRGMFSALLQESCSASLPTQQAVFIGASIESQLQPGQQPRRPLGFGLQRRIESPEAYTTAYFNEKALKDTRTMSELKREAVRQVLLSARDIMIEHKTDQFGEALGYAFPNHRYDDNSSSEEDEDPQGDEDDDEAAMTMQMERDAILTCFLVFESEYPGRFKKFITTAKEYDYSSQLDEDMMEDVEDLRQSLQETLEEVDPDVFDFSAKFTGQAFIWATGLIEALSLSFHIDGQRVEGVLALRDAEGDTDNEDNGQRKRKHE
ncbi:hypothetical protein BGZ99_003980 [Dissophora globulifera]|uniref:Rubisco LSMT substrate-binding domain-containing protein n=1 Tax=Dissophora globulifera TaxID=979702 RepID=A0A9P6RJ40_9FUNG|nr:hypothetical protein BGZ99_003980 [Dissophora globulifera]